MEHELSALVYDVIGMMFTVIISLLKWLYFLSIWRSTGKALYRDGFTNSWCTERVKYLVAVVSYD